GASASGVALPVGSTDAKVDTVHQHVVFDRFAEPWLPAAFAPAVVSSSREQITLDSLNGTLFAPTGTYRGFSYDVTSVAVSPTSADLDALASFAQPVNQTGSTELPASTPPEITSIAHQLTNSQPTTYRKILAIQDYLLS